MNDISTDVCATELRLRGHAVLPAPRCVELREGSVAVSDCDWGVRLADVAEDDIAVRTLLSRMKEDRLCDFVVGERKLNTVELAVEPGAVDTGLCDGRDEQAYRIEATPERIRLLGNGRAGLFYAVQTFMQLAAGPGIPLGTLADWPQYEIRAIHWDTKHHQDRMATLKRYLDQAAEFKINAI
ncbi:MAG: glycoside hydrolase family 20 zincin-like fold domain-containing protein, partial [Planctomycetota bacterium]